MMATLTTALTVLLVASLVAGEPNSPASIVDQHGTKVAREEKGKQSPSTLPKPNAYTSHGCYSSSGNLTAHGPVDKLSSGSCNDACKADGFWVSGLHATKCLCGYAYPPGIDVVDNKNCNYPCLYYDLEACGGLGNPGYWSVFNLGVNVDAVAYERPPTTSSLLPKPTSTSVSEQLSLSNNPFNESDVPTKLPDSGKMNSPNTVSIAAGVGVGVVGASLLLGGIFLLRRKRKAEREQHRHRSAVANDYISSANSLRTIGSSGIMSTPDARLDPVMAHRRLSDGSIEDSKDYSRKVLRVMNP